MGCSANYWPSATTFLEITEMTPTIIGGATLHHGDCIEVLRTLTDDSIDSIVTDPPYGLKFMGKKWDYDVPRVEVWAECLRVLKPGGYLLSFGGTRTYHRLATRIEDAGFEMHPMMAWLFGSGFPKATRVELPDMEGWRYGLQSLKPALEPIAFAQKPFSEKTGTANIKRWGTGALNIGACRVTTSDALQVGSGGLWSHIRDGRSYPNGREGEISADQRYTEAGGTSFAMKPGPRGGDPTGRWPANLAHDGSAEVVALFPSEAGQQAALKTRNSDKTRNTFGEFTGTVDANFQPHDTRGSAARFFYSPKASRKDRNEGTEALPQKAGGMVSNTSGQHMTRRDDGYEVRPQGNHHPTVKPTDLIAYYVRLVTPPGGTVLDLYMGSGTTGKACAREGFNFVGIERDEDENGQPLGYLEIAKARIEFEIGAVARRAAEALEQQRLASQQTTIFELEGI
jgi:site-specific DNA-methyltransferase (adenine-specific)